MTTWVMLRGLMRDERHWQGFVERLIAAGERVITVDLPGNGRLASEQSPTSIEAYCDSVWGQVLPHINPFRGKSVVLIGLSMGGMTALALASRYPDRIRQVVLLNSSAANLSPWYRRFRLLPLLRAMLGGVRLKLTQLGAGLSLVEACVLQYTSLYHGDNLALIANWSRWRDEGHTSLCNGIRQLIACARFQAPPLSSIPVTVICAAEDRLADPRCSQALASFYHTQALVLPSCGHDISLDAPEALLASLQANIIDDGGQSSH
ncbi:alpha/beta fold hydrolase [Shewanella loihica]|uniref:Alpha/beta hydrolase fold n=1 Tax=Shewanella loihica (strain ATCC BAA-1088 / PV-4) TaxID=323850 RepID=A3QHD6_SHELP|nr:alpha/beta hydrolase [Shewanella loihica]ABO24884.1 alpha/beta hydrolase fold [Shewanella loihica PV-4]